MLQTSEIGWVALCLAWGCLMVLPVNWPPAAVYLGDNGSIPLGFLAATLGLLGIQHSLWAWYIPVLAFLPFIADATVTLARRVLQGHRFWVPHEDHYFQRLARAVGPETTLGIYLCLMLACALAAIVLI